MWTPATRCCLHRRRRRRNDFAAKLARRARASRSVQSMLDSKSSQRTNTLWRTANNQPVHRHHVAVAIALVFPIPPPATFFSFRAFRRLAHIAPRQPFPDHDFCEVFAADGQDAAGSAVIAAWSSLSPTWACARDLREVQTAVVDELAKTAARFGAFRALSFAPRRRACFRSTSRLSFAAPH